MGFWNYFGIYVGLTIVVKILMFMAIENEDDVPFFGNINKYSRGRRIAIRLAIFFLWPIWIPIAIAIMMLFLFIAMIYSLFK